jgi:hypothetical protein
MNTFFKKPTMPAPPIVAHSKTVDDGIGEYSVRLIEEMIDLKVQQYAESQMRTTPELAKLLHEKRETDRRRLDQIRAELIRVFKG